MNCEYGEKLILYFYGEAGEALREEVEGHLASCGSCRLSLSVLNKAAGRLSEAQAGPSAAAQAAVMVAARAQASRRRGFAFRWRPALLSGSLAAVMAGVFAFSGRGASADLAWNSGLDSKLDSVEYSVYQAQSDLAQASGDWEYNYSAVEDEGFRAQV